MRRINVYVRMFIEQFKNINAAGYNSDRQVKSIFFTISNLKIATIATNW
ncbi:MAG: hypothetical protein ACTS5F_00470 [Candidatus Hodgkinia cicadicola]